MSMARAWIMYKIYEELQKFGEVSWLKLNIVKNGDTDPGNNQD